MSTIHLQKRVFNLMLDQCVTMTLLSFHSVIKALKRLSMFQNYCLETYFPRMPHTCLRGLRYGFMKAVSCFQRLFDLGSPTICVQHEDVLCPA